MSTLRQRIFEAAKDYQLMNFATITGDGRPWVRYVAGKADRQLVFRFCSSIDTRKIRQVRENPNVHLSLGAKDLETAEHWLQVEGRAEVSTDRKEKKSFWFDDLENYFSGPDDPDYCIVIVRPSRIEYWTMESIMPEVWKAGRAV
ncbi:MAG: pyridoxamine 5'-phosphate oxidase family protein [Nitrospirota bacterium]|nr:pyridoxamine 5'-phosphate oxidase family protein [Nitrospirota bacterium]